MNNGTQELTLDRLNQVSGGGWPKGSEPWGRHSPRQSADTDAGRYLPPNKNNDVRSSVLTFF